MTEINTHQSVRGRPSEWTVTSVHRQVLNPNHLTVNHHLESILVQQWQHPETPLRLCKDMFQLFQEREQQECIRGTKEGWRAESEGPTERGHGRTGGGWVPHQSWVWWLEISDRVARGDCSLPKGYECVLRGFGSSGSLAVSCIPRLSCTLWPLQLRLGRAVYTLCPLFGLTAHSLISNQQPAATILCNSCQRSFSASDWIWKELEPLETLVFHEDSFKSERFHQHQHPWCIRHSCCTNESMLFKCDYFLVSLLSCW